MSTQLLHPVMTNAAENLDMLFRKARLSQETVGALIGVSGGQVSKLLRPQQTGQVWSLRQLAILADCFGVEPQDLMGPGSDLLKKLPEPEKWKLPTLLTPEPRDGISDQANAKGELLPIVQHDGHITETECDEASSILVAA